MRNEEFWNWAVRISIIGLFVIVVGAALQILAHIAVPIILAWVMATALLPVVHLLGRMRIPGTLGALLVVALLLATMVTIFIVLAVPLSYWISRTDELGQLLKEKLALIHRPLDMLKELGRVLDPISDGDKPPVFVSTSSTSMVNNLMGTLTPALDEFMVFLIALVFHLIYHREIQNGLVALVTDPQAKNLARNILSDIERNMSRYFGTVTLVNIFVGVVAAVIAAQLGFPHPFLWGVFAAVMNYIPYLGPLLVMGTFLIIGAIVSPTLHEAALAPLLYLAFNTIEGQIITPSIIGHRLTINPFLVFLSIAFWAWLWGPLGAFLAAPLLVVAMVVARHVSGMQSRSLKVENG
jgi:predicted PurR-regulated permease PerM